MKSTKINKFVLSGALLITAGVARADYSTYTQAIDAARPLFQAGDYAGAQKLTEEALSLSKNPEEKAGALLRLGGIYSKRNLYAQAREQWEKVSKVPDVSSGTKLAARSAVAISYGEEKNWEQSASEFQKIVEAPDATTKDKTSARLAMATAFLGAHNDSQAQKQLSILAGDTSLGTGLRSIAYAQLGENLLKTGQFEQARAAYQSLLLLPDVDEQIAIAAQVNIGYSYEGQHDQVKAQAEFVKAQVRAYTQVKWFTDRNRFMEGRTLMQNILTFGTLDAPLDAALRVQIGQLMMSESKPLEGRAQLETVVAKQYGPGLSAKEEEAVRSVKQSARLFIAKTYIQEGNKARARQLLQDLMGTENLNPGVLNGARTMLKELP